MTSDVPINGVIIKLIHLVFNILLIHTSIFLWNYIYIPCIAK